MEISHQTQKETDIVQLRGELDMFNSPELGTFLRGKIESGSKAVLVELENVTYLDSSGLGVLISAATRMMKASGQFFLVRPSSQVRRLLELTRLTEFFRILNSRDEFLRAA